MRKSFKRLSLKEQVLFAKRLSFLIKASVPILEGLVIIRKSKSKAKRQIFDQIIKDVEAGQTLAFSLGRFKNVFGKFAINIIQVGETSGSLEQNLNYLAVELKKKYELRRKIIGALIYPFFIIIATLSISFLLLIFVLPKILPIFASLNVNLPFTTRVLMLLSSFFVKDGIFVLAGLGLTVILFWILLKKAKWFHLFINRLILIIPIVGKMTRSYQLTNFFRTLGLLLKGGINIHETLKITAEMTENLLYRREIHKLAQSIATGKRISTHLEEAPFLFPEISQQMIATGEASGHLSETLLYLAEMYEDEVDETTKNLSGILEPALMIFMGVIVGFIAVSVITPIYEITQHLSPK